MFLDFGNVWGVDYDDAIDESNKIRSSTGISASWNSPLGPMTFVFSTDLSKADTDETEGFNFNLGTLLLNNDKENINFIFTYRFLSNKCFHITLLLRF